MNTSAQPASDREEVPCCQSIEITYSCGHQDCKYVQFLTNGKRVRSPSDPASPSCPEVLFRSALGSMTPMPHLPPDTAADPELPTNTTNVTTQDSSNLMLHSTTPLPTSGADIVHYHQHPLCGLFHITRIRSQSSCQACLRRNFLYEAKTEVSRLQHQLKRARRDGWSAASVQHIRQQLAEAREYREVEDLVVDALVPLVEEEEDG